jgi:preprotein translocase subunit SecY
MTAGVMLLGWLGDRISRHGVGTGFWLLLIAPHLVALPSTVALAVERM